MDKILVVIPYCSAGAQGRELEYAVAGWRKHFKENYLIVLAGENHPITKTGDDIVCIESERVPENDEQYRPHLDYVSCLKKVHAAFPDSTGFIMVADDCYAINDFDIIDVKLLKAINGEIYRVANPYNRWEVDAAKTRWRLTLEGYPLNNYTTHLPQWFDWDKIEEIWDRYDMEHVSYCIEDLYYNIHYSERIPVLLDEERDNMKMTLYDDKYDLAKLVAAVGKKIWLTNTPTGWNETLDTFLSIYYGI